MNDILNKIVPDKFRNKRIAIYGNYKACKKIAKEYGKENEFCVSRKCGSVKLSYPHIYICIKTDGIDAVLIATDKFTKEDELCIMPIEGN